MVVQLKQYSFRAAKRLGLTRRVATSNWRRRRLLVLCYHGVSLANEHEWNPELYISPATLARRFDTLRRMHCTVLPLDEAVARMYEGTLPERAVALTFDDGYYDFKAKALPLLQAYGYTATLYVTTHQCDRDTAITHLLTSYLLWNRGRSAGAGIPSISRRRDRMHPEDEGASAREAVEPLGLDYPEVTGARLLSVMKSSELAEVSKSGMTIEMHTHRHRAPVDPEAFVQDVRENRAKIEAITGRRPRHLCYPSGIYRASYLPHLDREDIETAATCDPALAAPSSHRLLLPRFVDSEACSQLTFEAWVAGVATWLPRRTRKANGVS